jgi:hypothetical protein
MLGEALPEMRIFRILADAEGKFIKKKPRAKRF